MKIVNVSSGFNHDTFVPKYTITLELDYPEFMDDLLTAAHWYAHELRGSLAHESALLFGQEFFDQLEKYETTEYGEPRCTKSWAMCKQDDLDFETDVLKSIKMLEDSEK